MLLSSSGKVHIREHSVNPELWSWNKHLSHMHINDMLSAHSRDWAPTEVKVGGANF
jgi:hypothetical protein